MKPAPFDYHRPATLDEALSLLARYEGDAKPLAGGQSLIPAMNFRLATPSVLVDLNAIPDLAGISTAGTGLRIGSMTRHQALERSAEVARRAGLVARAMPFIAHAAIRTRGTIGGSLAHADPAAELPAVMLALDATLTLQRAGATRTVPASEFFVGLFATALEGGELVTAVEIPAPRPGSGAAFDEVSRRHGDFALAGVAAQVTLDAQGVCTSARVALLSVADRPVLSAQVTQHLVGAAPTAERIRAAAEAAATDDIDPTSDIHASSRYRRRLAAVLTRRVLERAFQSVEPL